MVRCRTWVIKPFSAALFGWRLFRRLLLAWIGVELADQYVAGSIVLAAGPCTAMVFVRSYLTDGDPACTPVPTTAWLPSSSSPQWRA